MWKMCFHAIFPALWFSCWDPAKAAQVLQIIRGRQNLAKRKAFRHTMKKIICKGSARHLLNEKLPPRLQQLLTK
jgi:hypothetical protein